MSLPKQVLLSVLLLLVAGAVWLVYENDDLLFAGTPATVGGPAAGPSGVGRPAGAGLPASAVRVVTGIVETDSTATQVRAIGTAAASREVILYPQVTGLVSEVTFTPGVEVKAGDVLVRLEDTDEQIAVERATIALEAAREVLARAEKLAETGNLTDAALSDARTAERAAAIDLRSAEVELRRRSITAPFDGIVGFSDVVLGDLVSSSTPITTIDDMSSVTVAFTVPERVSGRVAIGQEVTATSAALPGETVTGTISAIGSRIDEDTRTLRLEATLPNPGEAVKPGMSMTIAFSIAGAPQTAVPSLAIQWDRNGVFVWKLDGDRVSRTPVQIIARRGGLVTVGGDLAAGEEVVVEGVLRLREGIAVARVGEDGERIAEPDPAAEPATVGTPSGGRG